MVNFLELENLELVVFICWFIFCFCFFGKFLVVVVVKVEFQKQRIILFSCVYNAKIEFFFPPPISRRLQAANKIIYYTSMLHFLFY